MFGCAGKIIYYTRNVIPTTVFLKIGTNRKALYLYEMQDFNKALIENINIASIVSTVAIYAPHVKVDANPFDYIFKANDVRFIADRLYFDFDSKVTIEDKEAFFDKVHEVLARWTIQLYLSYNNEKEKDKLKSDIINKVIGMEHLLSIVENRIYLSYREILFSHTPMYDSMHGCLTNLTIAILFGVVI